MVARVGRWATYILVSANEVAHICRRVLVELFIIAKNENGNVDGA
jgi:hypothetical protein